MTKRSRITVPGRHTRHSSIIRVIKSATRLHMSVTVTNDRGQKYEHIKEHKSTLVWLQSKEFFNFFLKYMCRVIRWWRICYGHRYNVNWVSFLWVFFFSQIHLMNPIKVNTKNHLQLWVRRIPRYTLWLCYRIIVEVKGASHDERFNIIVPCGSFC